MRVALVSGARSERMRKEAEGSANSFGYHDLLKMGTRFEAAEAREAEAKKLESKEVLAVSTPSTASQGFRGGNSQFYRGGRFGRSRGGFSGMRGASQGNYNRNAQFQPQGQPGQPWRQARGGPERQIINAPNSCKCCGLVHAAGTCEATKKNCNACGLVGHYGRCCTTFSAQKAEPQQVIVADKT